MTLSGLNLPYHEFVEAWQDIFWLNEPVARLIALLDAGWLHSTSGFEYERAALDLLPAPVRQRHWIGSTIWFCRTRSAT